MSQGTAETLVKKDQEDGDFHPLVGQAIGVTPAVTLEQAVGTHLAQVVAELVQSIAGRSQGVGGEDGLVNLGGTPAGQPSAAVEQNLHQADHARVVNLDTGEASGAQGDRQGQALEEREIDMHVERLGLESGEAVSNLEEFLAHDV